MKRFALALTVTLAVLVLGWAAARTLSGAPVFAADDAPVPQTGQTAPTFTLPSQEGSTVSLDAYRGKWVVLYFYPRDMTSGCTLEAHNFQQDLAKYDALHAVILGVSVDSVDSHKKFCTKETLTFKLLSDEDKKVVAEYGSLGNYMGIKIAKRNTFLIDPQGRIVKVWTGVDPSHHSQEVLAELGSLEHKG